MRRSARLAEEFAAALEGRGASSARLDPALAPLLSVAEGLQGVPLTPAADFRDGLRQRLLAVATVAPADVPAAAPAERVKTWVEGWRVQRAMTAAAASMAVVVGLSAVSVGASRSLPGDALYGVKRSAEGVQLGLARNDVNRGKRHLQHAETRLSEIAQLVDTDLAYGPAAPSGTGQITVAFGGSRSDRVGEGLRLMDSDTRDGTRLLFDAYANDRDEDALHAVRRFTERQRTHLSQVLDKLPTAAHADAEASLALVSNLDLRATQLLSVGTTCGADCATPAPVAPSPGEQAPTPAPTPSYDSLGPLPCTCPADPSAEPAPAAEPTPEPTPAPTAEPTQSPEPTPEPTQSPSPEPTPTESHYPLPSEVPPPVATPVQTVVDDVNEALPTPLPTLPPLPDAPAVPGVTVARP
jgi:hypothetical protein